MIRIRCSSLGLIMTDAKSVDERFLSDTVSTVVRKIKKTDEEKAMIQCLLDHSLSAGAKTYLKSIAKEFVYGYTEIVSGKYMDKGLIVEDQSIDLYNAVHFTAHKKNTIRLENDWITGECDIIIPAVKGIDIKSSWSLATFPAISEDGEDKMYEWQCRGYMMLHEVPQWEVAYCMVNTPDELIKYEQDEIHFVDHIEESLRITKVIYERDLALEEKIKIKVDAARLYMNAIIERIQQQHGMTA